MEGLVNFANSLVELPLQLQALIAGAVLYLVNLGLGKLPIPEEHLTKIAVAVSTALIAAIEVALNAIPLEFQPLAVHILQLIVLLFVFVVAKNLYQQGYLD